MCSIPKFQQITRQSLSTTYHSVTLLNLYTRKMIQQKTKSSITLITLIIATIVVKSQSKSHLLDKQLKNRLIESPTNRPFFSVISKPLRSNHLNQNVYKSHYNTNIISLERGGHDDDEIKVEHHTNPKLMFLIKLLFIAYYSSLGALMPYLPVYYHSLGHSGQAIGLLGAVKPLTTFLVAPLWGIISDYYQKPGFIMQLTFISSLILQLLLPLNDSVHYLVAMVFITAVFNAPVKSLIDSMVMDKLNKDDRGQYGRLRLYGQLGFGLGSSIVGTFITNRSFVPVAPSSAAPSPELNQFIQGTMEVIEEVGAASAASEQSTKTAIETLSFLLQSSIEKLTNMRGYKLAFVAYGIMSIPAFLAMKAFQRFDSGEATPKNNEAKSRVKGSPRILQGINMLLHNADAMLFFFLVLIVGITSGIIENFAYVRLREVGGTGKEMGICRLVSSLSGAPMFWFSGPLTEKLGADRVLVLSLISYIFRFLNYAFMKNPYHALPAEALRGVAFAAFWSTGTVFAHKISPPGMSATMLLFMNAMYGGLGQSIGAIGGGKLQSKVGTVNTFIYSAAADFLFVIFVTIYLSLRKDSNFRNPQQIQIVKS